MLTSRFATFFAHPIVGAVLTASIVVTLVGCDYGSAKYEPFENAEGGAGANDCDVGLASFKTNIASSIGGCSCHLSGQSPRLARNADEDNRKALVGTQRDYAYLTGGHQGAAAFKAGISENQWNTWRADEQKCP